MTVRADWSVGSDVNTVRTTSAGIGSVGTRTRARGIRRVRRARTRARGRDGVVCVACLESDVECFVCVVFGTVRLLRLTEAPRCSFIRSQIVCFNTAAVMGAMRFGFMPSVKKNYGGASSYKMVDQEGTKNIGSKDPAGFTAVDVLAAGSFATILSAGEILSGQVPY